ncbi:hypothetical protein GW777_05725 [Candidatus Peregrinibacteria bacterium]|nr:hypothetical protein [bacterium]NCQ55786.1 hypothetical protein [Candidatus Parcubacteria bacterium]NCS67853.1 hypothetical protein [Candidatus Peregrinibacteria bacterium]
MSSKPKLIKIRLKAGDKPGDVLQYLKNTKAKQVCLIIERDFLVVTESSFIQRLQGVLKIIKAEVWFVTQKQYFQSVLSQHKMRVQGYEPEQFADIETKTLSQIQGKVAAQKNAFEARPIEFKPKLQSTTTTKPQFSTRKIENIGHERSLRGIYFFIVLVLIGALGWLYFWVSPQANIVIKPRINTTEVTQNLVLGLPGAVWDVNDENLPKITGIEIQTEKVETQAFASTGRTYNVTNASGQVTLFNTTREPKYFLPSRLQSEDGVIVRMQNEVTVPPANADGPGSIAVQVVADEFDEEGNPVGQRGNLEAGTELFFPGLRSETRELYYGKANLGPLVGGSTLTRYFVQEEDSVLAQPLLAESLRIQAVDSLKTELDSRSEREQRDYVLIEQASVLQSELIDFQYDETQTGQDLQAFEVQGTLKLSGLVFDQSQVIDIMSQKLEESQDDRKKIVNIDASSIDYRILETEKFPEDKWIKLSVTITGVETLDFEANNQFAREWQQGIKKEIIGLSVDSARGLLLNHPEIEEIVKLEIKPFWLQQLPVIVDQIKLDIIY